MPKGVPVLLLDSALVPRRDRVELITTVMSAASEASVVLEPHPEVHARMDLWQLGRLQLFRSESSGIAMACSRGQARRNGVPIVALAVQERSRARHEQFDHQQEIAPGALMAVDLTAAFAFSWRTQGASRALQIPISELDLPTDVIRRAVPRIRASPLARIVTTHIVGLFRDADPISRDPRAADFGDAGISLARALLASASGAAGIAREVHHETLLSQVREYVRQNLRDPDLTGRSIARAHNISLRHLYYLFADADPSLEQWIITRRLEGAAMELAMPNAGAVSIAALARRWGFRDPAHFSRRFRTAYGMTPRVWRATAAEERKQGGTGWAARAVEAAHQRSGGRSP